ncbi:hypothetical protein BDZ94DRAFT_158948 [Collybia nuda]|uniref:Uncharacterized protein n=1 Tax=Collybia nuda TaxID=64659 RepID=A0A9P5XWM9_9AGAR|nr:hypothetical protein BDZ94DRAFT_158948 [Collybia nuda]
MHYFLALSTYIALATAVAVPYATGSSSKDIINTSTITHRASNSSVPLTGNYAPIRLSGVVGTDGSSMTGTGFLLETPKAFPRYARFGDNRMHLGYKSLLYDYQSLRPTMGAIHPPLTAGHAEEYLRDIEVDKEIMKLPGVSNSVKERIIETRHLALKYGLYDGVLPRDISEEDKT